MTSRPAPDSRRRALYVCYLGLDDPLAHTQVVAYLAGLSRRGHTIHLVTFESGRLTRARREALRAEMAARGIAWHGLRYHRRPSLPATAYDVIRGAVVSAVLIRRHRIDLLHARSHVPAAMALIAARFARFRLLFDVRGLMAEEYVDAGRWRAGSAAFRLTKAVERAALRRSAGAVVLTDRVRRLLFARDDPRVEVIPCCVDLAQVDAQRDDREPVRDRLGLRERSVLLYVGKFTGWYLQGEMVDFFARARRLIPDLHFLVLSQSDHALIEAEFERHGVPVQARTIATVGPQEIGSYLAAADAAIAFIRPCHSKISSSPTKIGEYLAAGLPVVTGAGIGDVDRLLADYDSGVVLESFAAESLEDGVQRLRARVAESGHADRSRRAAAEHLSLESVGVPRYDDLYRRLANTSWQPAEERRSGATLG